MSKVGLVTLALGLLVVGTRGPLAVAPAATLRGFRRLVSTNNGVRSLVAVVLILGAAMVMAGMTEDSAFAGLVTVVGWWICAIGTLVVVFPAWYRELAHALLPAVQEERLPGWRLLGILGTSVGLLLIYVGVRSL
jgi:hypothetical protein